MSPTLCYCVNLVTFQLIFFIYCRHLNECQVYKCLQQLLVQLQCNQSNMDLDTRHVGYYRKHIFNGNKNNISLMTRVMQ